MFKLRFHLRGLIIILIGLITLAGCEKKPMPNIVLINIDDMGWRDVGFMGSQYYATPNIDALASRGMIFTSAYSSASNCAPSRACLMSGQWGPRHGIYTVGSSKRGKSKDRKLIPTQNNITLPLEITTLAEALQEAGYSTCHAGKWHLGKDPTEQGFDVNIGGNHSGGPGSYYSPYGSQSLDTTTGEYLTDQIMRKAIEFVRETDTDPFFLYYAPYAVHKPICPVDSLMHKYINKKAWMGQGNPEYATMIDNLDRNIGNLITTLNEKGVMDNTLMIFTSDNGGHITVTWQRPLRSGKGSYYEGGIRVPMAIVWEGRIKAGRASDVPVTHMDLYPTILDIAGIESPVRKNLDGTSLLPILFKNSATKKRLELDERPLFWHFPIYLEAYDKENDESRDPLFRTRPGSVVRKGDWKLHQYFEDGGLELYNLKDDIGERDNLSELYPDMTRELLTILEQWRESTEAPLPTEENPEYSDTLRAIR